MNIMLAFNSNYIDYAAVLIRSLVYNEKEQLNISIIHSSLTESDKKYLVDLTSDCDHVDYFFYQFTDSVFNDMSHASYLSKETYFRLLGWNMLPDSIDRILYLDCDMIINSSISVFYYQDLQNNTLAACPGLGRIPEDIPLDKIKANLDIEQDIQYCNAGVILFNLNAMRSRVTTDSLLSYIRMHKNHLYMADQDIINGYFAGSIKYCDPLKYNYASKKYVLKKYGKKAVNNAHIIHFCLKYKPDSVRYTGTCSNLFWKYASLISPCPFKYHKKLNILYKIIIIPITPIYNILRKIYLKARSSK